MKTLIILFVLGYLIPCFLFFVVHYYNWRKSFAKIQWWTVIYFVGVFGLLTQWIMFFPAWWARKIPILKWIFWIWLDDSRYIKRGGLNLYAEDYLAFLDGEPETIWPAYKWHMRNRVWNLGILLRPNKGEREIIETVKDNLFMGGKRVNQRAYWIPMARLKYWHKGVEGSQINRGDTISKTYSIFGIGYVWEKIGKRLTFRYSFLKSFLGLWWNFVAGENDKRFVFTLKIKRKKPIK